MTPRAVFERIAGWLSGAPRRPAGSRGAGWDWERAAERALVRAGYRILDRNFRTPNGELDFVAEEDGVVCFVEVKGRSGPGFGLPEEAVTLEKQRRIHRAAESWISRRRREGANCRFDVVSVVDAGGEPRIEIFRNAFESPPPRRTR